MRVVRKRSRMRVKRGEGRGSCSITVANVILLFVNCVNLLQEDLLTNSLKSLISGKGHGISP